jgi:glycine cleavage system H protein
MSAAGTVDLFATKGIEYLLVLLFLAGLVLFWRMLQWPGTAPVSAVGRAMTALTDWFSVPEGFFYHQGHSWALPEADGVVRVGVDDFARRLLGEPQSLSLPRVGSRVAQGEPGWTVNVGGRAIPMLSPVHGEVIEVNADVRSSPGLVNGDPYERGWLFKVKASRLGADLNGLLSGRLARAWLDETVDSLRRRMSGGLALAYEDGGTPVSGIARSLSAEHWEEIAREFLGT